MLPKTQVIRGTLVGLQRHLARTVSKGTFTLFAFVSLASFVSLPPRCDAQYEIDRTADQRKMWLSWSKPERERFVLGYLWAYHLGFSSGCVTYFDQSGANISTDVETSRLQKCKLQELVYSKDADYYARRITEYYAAYPKDHDLPVSRLMRALSDTEKKDATEIHAMWSHRRVDR